MAVLDLINKHQVVRLDYNPENPLDDHDHKVSSIMGTIDVPDIERVIGEIVGDSINNKALQKLYNYRSGLIINNNGSSLFFETDSDYEIPSQVQSFQFLLSALKQNKIRIENIALDLLFTQLQARGIHSYKQVSEEIENLQNNRYNILLNYFGYEHVDKMTRLVEYYIAQMIFTASEFLKDAKANYKAKQEIEKETEENPLPETKIKGNYDFEKELIIRKYEDLQRLGKLAKEKLEQLERDHLDYPKKEKLQRILLKYKQIKELKVKVKSKPSQLKSKQIERINKILNAFSDTYHDILLFVENEQSTGQKKKKGLLQRTLQEA